MSLKAIISEIERRYNVNIEVPESLAQIKLVLFHDRPDNVDVLLEVVTSVTGSSFRTISDGYEILDPIN